MELTMLETDNPPSQRCQELTLQPNFRKEYPVLRSINTFQRKMVWMIEGAFCWTPIPIESAVISVSCELFQSAQKLWVIVIAISILEMRKLSSKRFKTCPNSHNKWQSQEFSQVSLISESTWKKSPPNEYIPLL